MPPLRRIGFAAAVALSVGLSAIAIGQGMSDLYPVRLLEWLAIGVVATFVLATLATLVMGRMADWREPETEAEFEQVVRRSERLAREGLAAEPTEGDFMRLDPLDDSDFEELVRDALDELPDLLRNALAHVAVVISDDGRKMGAYGLYHGDGVHRDEVPDRIVIYRDTLRRDFGHDPDLLREQVVRTVRHELAHHVGFDEMGVQGLGL
ncbi:MAG: metallopeptidase family protein [Solirubrobacterales bacterium]|jgi:predicted Zn-dependent protease with MMP-like domain|nr:metallopeptidase family protein [Solirubrobacterales bacterium]